MRVMKLGQVLKAARLASGKTLREVEAGTGISNGHLSQLESDAVKRPSPNHLGKLAEFYRLDYSHLMELVGYAPPRQVGAVIGGHNQPAFSGLEELTEEDKRKIQAYIEDLRDARRVRAMSTRAGTSTATKTSSN
jgi:transcriptional regulator with XRE-family HTH domain